MCPLEGFLVDFHEDVRAAVKRPQKGQGPQNKPPSLGISENPRRPQEHVWCQQKMKQVRPSRPDQPPGPNWKKRETQVHCNSLLADVQ